jgi:4-hydroxy-3-polyprenylbenzoate decarboxylase
MKLVLAITGASGVIYGVRLAEELHRAGVELFVVVTKAAKKIFAQELPDGLSRLSTITRVHDEDEIDAAPASGSSLFNGVVVCPCSTRTLASISLGLSCNLVARSADVALKEGRKLVLVVRETPLSAIHLRSMLKLSKLGVVILPASPAFYPKSKAVEDLVNYIVGKVLDVLHLEHSLFKRWSS